MPGRLIALFAMLLSLSLVAAGCGGSMSKEEYQSEVDRIGRNAEKELDRVIAADAPLTEENLSEARTVFAGAADDLEGLDAPEEVLEAHELMVGGLRDLGAAFGTLATKVGKAETDAERTEIFLNNQNDPELRAAFEKLGKAQELFEEKGYTVFDKGEETDEGSAGEEPGEEPAVEPDAAPDAEPGDAQGTGTTGS